MICTITRGWGGASVVVNRVPPWFLSRFELQVEDKPFAREPMDLMYRGVWGAGNKSGVEALFRGRLDADQRTYQTEYRGGVGAML